MDISPISANHLLISTINLLISTKHLKISTIQLLISTKWLICGYLQMIWRYQQINCRYQQLNCRYLQILNKNQNGAVYTVPTVLNWCDNVLVRDMHTSQCNCMFVANTRWRSSSYTSSQSSRFRVFWTTTASPISSEFKLS